MIIWYPAAPTVDKAGARFSLGASRALWTIILKVHAVALANADSKSLAPGASPAHATRSSAAALNASEDTANLEVVSASLAGWIHTWTDAASATRALQRWAPDASDALPRT